VLVVLVVFFCGAVGEVCIGIFLCGGLVRLLGEVVVVRSISLCYGFLAGLLLSVLWVVFGLRFVLRHCFCRLVLLTFTCVLFVWLIFVVAVLYCFLFCWGLGVYIVLAVFVVVSFNV